MANSAELLGPLEAVAKGDEAAFARLYAATSAKLYGVVLRILRRPDLADEVMQDAYLRVWQDSADFDPRTDTPMTWMVAIARKRAIDLMRDRGQDTIEDEGGSLDGASEDVGSLDRQSLAEGLRRLLACLGELEPERRRLVLLAYYSGWSRKQLAARFATEPESVKAWLRGSLLRIRECLGS